MLPYQFLLPKSGRSCNCNKLWSITAGTVSRFPVSFTQVLQLLPCTTEQASLLSQCKKAQSSKTNKLRIGSIFFFIILAARWHLFSILILTNILLTCVFLYTQALFMEMYVSHPFAYLITLGKCLYTPSCKSRNKNVIKTVNNGITMI